MGSPKYLNVINKHIFDLLLDIYNDRPSSSVQNNPHILKLKNLCQNLNLPSEREWDMLFLFNMIQKKTTEIIWQTNNGEIMNKTEQNN